MLGGKRLGALLPGVCSIISLTAGVSLTTGGQQDYYSWGPKGGYPMFNVGLKKSDHISCHLQKRFMPFSIISEIPNVCRDIYAFLNMLSMILSRETGISSCRILGSGAMLPDGV